jgi:murein DD-endopeptidase MepM/ murein hydrolase activator NlpD
MAQTHSERLRKAARESLEKWVFPVRRHVLLATALTFVFSTVLLVLGARLPFPPPGEPILYEPADWSLLFAAGSAAESRPAARQGVGLSMGGLSTNQPPVAILQYRAHRGDTMSSIATKLGVSTDTLSSLNRVDGRGVHSVMVGELLKVPSEDGIPVAFTGDLDAFAQKYKVSADDVLAANGLTRDQLTQGMSLFLPKVQHEGAALMISIGAFVGKPLASYYESSPFGVRQDPFTGALMHHSGVDLAAPMGTPIRSATNGVVVQARYDSMLGNYVAVSSLKRFTYIYGHMSAIKTYVGAHVAEGQVIGLVGDTGYATGPHLHFEVRKDGLPQNPRLYLPGIR